MKEDFSICSKIERENFRFSLEANPVGCQKKYLLVPKGISRKLFSNEKKLIVRKFGNWARRNLAVSSIFFCRFDKAGFYLSGRTIWEELSKEKRFFLQHVWTENKKVRPPGQNFSQRCQNIVLPVHKNNLRKLSSEVLLNFLLLFAIEQEVCWTKKVRGIAEICRKHLSSANLYWRGPFEVSESLWIQKTKHKSGITLFF